MYVHQPTFHWTCFFFIFKAIENKKAWGLSHVGIPSPVWKRRRKEKWCVEHKRFPLLRHQRFAAYSINLAFVMKKNLQRIVASRKLRFMCLSCLKWINWKHPLLESQKTSFGFKLISSHPVRPMHQIYIILSVNTIAFYFLFF